MICFLDLDDVLVDFVKEAHLYWDIPYPDDFISNYPYELGNWNVFPEQCIDISANKFWNGFTEEFWTNLGWTCGGKQLLETAEKIFGQKNICILTTPTVSPLSVSGKLMWIQKNMPKYSRQFLIGPPKYMCAHKNAVLVDDVDHNIDNFKTHSGNGLLVPRPWNSLHNEAGVKSDSDILKEWFHKFCDERS